MKLSYYSVLLYSVTFAHHVYAEQQLIVTDRASVQSQPVISATRTSTPERWIPQTINSVSTEMLTAFGQPTFSEALAGIPGINASGDTRFDGVMIRGFSGSGDFYLDGVRDDMQYPRDLTNTERVEVLKGPAAVLYGRGGGGGIINRISKKPQKGLPTRISGQAGSYDFRRLHTDINGQASDNLLFRLNMAQENKHHFRRGVTGERTVLAPQLSWQPTEEINWLLQYEYQHNKRTPDRGIPGINGRPAQVDKHLVYSNTERDFIDDRVNSLRSRLTYDINYQWQLRYMLSYMYLNSQFDNTYVTSVRLNNAHRARWQQDLQTRNIVSNLEAEGTFSGRAVEHRLLMGFEQSWQVREPKLWNNKTPIAAQNLFYPQAFVPDNGEMKLSSHSQHRGRNAALYVQDQLTWDNWHLLAGTRYDRFQVSTTRVDRALQETRTNNHFSPRLGLVWNPLASHAFYLSYSKSYLPTGGGLIGITPGRRSNILPPEQVRQYETGIKSDWLNNRVSTALSLYRLEMYNRRTADPENPQIIRLIGLQRTDGIEFTVNASLADAFYLRGGVALQNARLVKAESSEQGKRPGNVSKQNGSFYFGWRHPQGWFAETGVIAVGQRYAEKANVTLLPGYYKFDARAGYRWNRWDVQLSVENLFNQDYYQSATSSAQIMPGAPRQFHLSLSYLL